MKHVEVWLWRSKGVVGRIIRAQDWSPVNHVGIRFCETDLYLDVGMRKGCRLLRTADVEQPQSEDDGAVFKYGFRVSENNYYMMLEKATELNGRSYDHVGLLRFLAPTRQALRTLGITKASKRRICSSAVEEVLRAGGRAWVSRDVPIERITPGSFWASVEKDRTFTTFNT